MNTDAKKTWTTPTIVDADNDADSVESTPGPNTDLFTQDS
jgi:hypothetical protein